MSGTFLQLASAKMPSCPIGGWFVSEKLDGMRAYWDGGVTSGMLKSDVPWANHVGDERYKEAPRCTGLWSRYGNVIHAPDWWLAKLPEMPLDGELYNHGAREDLMSTVKSLVGGNGWSNVSYHVFDTPAYETVFSDRVIKIPNCEMDMRGAFAWMQSRCSGYMPSPNMPFQSTVKVLAARASSLLHKQTRLPWSDSAALRCVESMCEAITSRGGEGVIVRSDSWPYAVERSSRVVKVKPRSDAEGVVVGYTKGRGKYSGMLGALIIEWEGRQLELSGMTDAERARAEEIFPLGTIVSFKYRGLTKHGVPQEAVYWRIRGAE